MKRVYVFSVSVVIILTLPVILFAAGFQVPEQGVAAMGMGSAFIGKADDPSAIYHNPAGLTQLQGTHVYGDVVGITVAASYTREGFDKQENKDDLIPVPLLAVTTDFGGRFGNIVAALAVNAPFGLRNAYDEQGPQRYITTNISLVTLYTGPYVGWQITPNLSIGGGVQYVYASAEIEQKINYGVFLDPRLNENPDYDGKLSVEKATDNGFSANAGLLFTPIDALSVGVSWRSGIELDIEGDVKLTIPAGVTQLSGGLLQSLSLDGKTTVALPQTVGAGVAYRLTEQLTVSADVNWINWSVYENLDFDFDPDVLYLPDTEGPRNWDDAIAVRLGAEYWIADKYALRAGYLFDQSPVPDNTLGPELPCADRNGISLGGGFRLNNLTIDLAYSHIFLEDRSVSESLRSPQPLGDYETSADLFAISLDYAF